LQGGGLLNTNPNWYFDEKQIGMDYLDPKIAEKYEDQHLEFRNFKTEAEDVLNKLDITSKDTVLDFGCGTGGIALNIADYCKKVICVDISNAMLNILKDKAEIQNIKNIETHCAGFLTYHHGDKVDKIVSKAALHHLPDFWKSVALLNMANTLKKDGKLYFFDVIFTFNPQDYQSALENTIQNMRNAAGDSMAEETIIHIKDEFSTYDWIMEGLFEKTGFSIESKNIETENYITYICSKH
jgi:putative AdoMet-dependent methyltransferase